MLLSTFIAKLRIESSLDGVIERLKKEEDPRYDFFQVFPTKVVVNAIMNRLEEDHCCEDSMGWNFNLIRILSSATGKRFSSGRIEAKELDRMARILSWKEFREKHTPVSFFGIGNWRTKMMLVLLENRTSGSEASRLVEDFKEYCKKSGKRVPRINDVLMPAIP